MTAPAAPPFRVLILGGYGNFGALVARGLAHEPGIALIIAGRSIATAQAFVAELGTGDAVAIDVTRDLGPRLSALAPDLVINTAGPFQGQDYHVARAAMAVGAHYCDLADARDYVCGIGALDGEALAKGLAVIVGASSVPCLTAAYLDDALESGFAAIESVDYGISAAQQANRGTATAKAVLGYVGKPFTMLRGGRMARVFGWGELHGEVYPGIGRRWFGNCDVPDLDLFPARYPGLAYMRFAAGHELAILHIGTWLCGGLVRAGLLPSLGKLSGLLLPLAWWFDRFGKGESGFHMRIEGRGQDGERLARSEWIVARSGHGVNIPAIPAILLARRLARGEAIPPGARPCLDLITLDDYLGALAGFDIEVIRSAAK